MITEKHVAQSGRNKSQSPHFLSGGRMEKGLLDTGMTLKTRFARHNSVKTVSFYWVLRDAADRDSTFTKYFKSIFG